MLRIQIQGKLYVPEDHKKLYIGNPEVSSDSRDGKWNMKARFTVSIGQKNPDILTIELTKSIPIEDLDQHPPFPVSEMRKRIEDFFEQIRAAA